MSEFKTTSDYSLVSIILPKLTGEPVVQSLGKNGARHILQSTSRGSLLNEGGGFFSKMFPPPRTGAGTLPASRPQCQAG